MNELNIDRFTKALSEILSRKHDAKITIKAVRKPQEAVENEVANQAAAS